MMSLTELRKAPRWKVVLDAVAQQKDAEYSGLYWYTDLGEAQAAAKREKKPILSLRLLGKLTEDLSCANSRFFRTTLYPNPHVRELLATKFVLHWQSVRAVPIITIDLGNGRQIKRTITGNSLHMVLDEQGRTVDILPGLYAAEDFVRELHHAVPVAVAAAKQDDQAFRVSRAEFHRGRMTAMRQDFDELLKKLNIPSLPLGVDHPGEVWLKLGLFGRQQAVIEGDAQRAVLERAAQAAPPAAAVAAKIALTKQLAETPAMRLVRNVTLAIAEDSVRNEYFLHHQIHQWLSAGINLEAREDLVAQVYSQLFLSPLDDPWYGLSQPDIYSALENDGRVNAVAQNAGH
jgi:hypothetical protein